MSSSNNGGSPLCMKGGERGRYILYTLMQSPMFGAHAHVRTDSRAEVAAWGHVSASNLQH